jgi:hypothetical protein
MSSETSTEARTFRPWHLFVLVGLLASTVGVLVIRPNDPVVLALLVAAIGSAAWVGFTLYRTLSPLAAPDFQDRTDIIAGRTRAALEREKTLALRALKELEFDRAMGKVAPADFQEMSGMLRARAIALMQQLDIPLPGHRDEIERELARRLGVTEEELRAARPAGDALSPVCAGCGTANDLDARFCKGCGALLEAPA